MIAVAASSIWARASFSAAVAPSAASMPVRLSSVAPPAALVACSTAARLWTATSAWRAAPSATRAALAASSEIAWPVSPSRACIDAHMSWNSPVDSPKVCSVPWSLPRTAPSRSERSRPGPASPIERRSPPIDANVSK